MSIKLASSPIQRVIEVLYGNKTMSASNINRGVLETLCRNGLASKVRSGMIVTYQITDKGEDLYHRGTENGNWHYISVRGSSSSSMESQSAAVVTAAKLSPENMASIRKVFMYCDMHVLRSYSISVHPDSILACNHGTTSRAWFKAEEGMSLKETAQAIYDEAIAYMTRKLAKLGRSDVPKIDKVGF